MSSTERSMIGSAGYEHIVKFGSIILPDQFDTKGRGTMSFQ
jgi:hypothetical protein